MPVHDWTRVDAGIFHAFHTAWIGQLQAALNEGLLPRDYYALAEQHAGRFVPDLLTLHAASPAPGTPADGGGLALADAPPRVRRQLTLGMAPRLRQRTLAVRHVSGHRLVAILEIVSPGNKDRPEHVEELAAKVESVLRAGVHVLLVDLLPPGPADPQGMHGAVQQWYDGSGEPYELPVDEPLTLASYRADRSPEAYLEHLASGTVLPDMPLFFDPGRYINVPLERTYDTAFRGMPAFWREALERPPA